MPKENHPRWLIIHHTGAGNSFEIDNQWHKQRWPQFISELGFWLGYHYWISRKGEIKQARRTDREGAHCRGMNTSSIGIALQGNFSEYYPTNEQKTALKGLLVELMRKYNIPLKRIVPHRFFSPTECFGKNLPNSFARDLAAEETLKYNDEQLKVKLLEKQIGIIEQLIRIYVALIQFLKRGKFGRDPYIEELTNK